MAAIATSPDSTTASVTLTLSGVPAGITTAYVKRVDPDGNESAIVGGDPATVSGGIVLTDYLAPVDKPIRYKAYGPNDEPGMLLVTSAPVTLLSQGKTWLKHPGQPSLNTTIQGLRGNLGSLVRDLPQGIFRPIGRKRAIVASGDRWEPTSTLSFVTWDTDQARKVRSLLDGGGVLLLQRPAVFNDLDSAYIGIGATSEDKIDGETAFSPRRLWSMDVTVTSAPINLSKSAIGNTWNDVVDAYESWDGAAPSVMDEKGSWYALAQHVAPD